MAEDDVQLKRLSAESTASGMSYLDPYEKPKKKSIQTYLFGAGGKKQGGYTSLFHRKLLPPLGFYREVDKYCKLKAKYANDEEKIEAVNDMWQDYKKYQIRKRFRWPPTLFFKKFFWTTGYYADYQKTHRATRIKRPGDDSSDDELADNVVGAFLVAGGDHDDVNLDEFKRYQHAKRRMTMGVGGHRFDDVGNANKMLAPKSTESRLFGNSGATPEMSELEKQRLAKERADKERADKELADKEQAAKGIKDKEKRAGKKAGKASTVEEIETVVEYTIIKNPDKKKRSLGGASEALGISELTAEEAAHAAAGKKVVSTKKSVTKTEIDSKTGKVLSKDVKEHKEERGVVH